MKIIALTREQEVVLAFVLNNVGGYESRTPRKYTEQILNQLAELPPGVYGHEIFLSGVQIDFKPNSLDEFNKFCENIDVNYFKELDHGN